MIIQQCILAAWQLWRAHRVTDTNIAIHKRYPIKTAYTNTIPISFKNNEGWKIWIVHDIDSPKDIFYYVVNNLCSTKALLKYSLQISIPLKTYSGFQNFQNCVHYQCESVTGLLDQFLVTYKFDFDNRNFIYCFQFTDCFSSGVFFLVHVCQTFQHWAIRNSK